ncbi:MAG: gluconeogenesis factor YvcK family protein [Candidatus Paceibacterota bacterium]
MAIQVISTIGGGSGQYELLRSLVNFPDLSLRAIVTMADDGGSSGELRTQLGVLPAGDLRQCLVALASESESELIKLMNFRFTDGSYSGDNIGNLIFAACEKLWGLEESLRFLGKLFQIRGEIIPVTFQDVTLIARMTTGQIIRGEDKIGSADLHRLEQIYLEPKNALVNPRAIDSINESEAVIVGPGDLHTSILPNLLVSGVCEALKQTKAKLVYVCNLMTKAGQTDGLSVGGFTTYLENYIGRDFDTIVFNGVLPPLELSEHYRQEGESPVVIDNNLDQRFVGVDLISKEAAASVEGDSLKRSLLRHDRQALAAAIKEVINGPDFDCV